MHNSGVIPSCSGSQTYSHRLDYLQFLGLKLTKNKPNARLTIAANELSFREIGLEFIDYGSNCLPAEI